MLLFYNIRAMHNIKFRKQTTNQTNSFALKLKTETNENNTTANTILQNTQTTCPIKQCKLAYPSDTWHNSSFFRKKNKHVNHRRVAPEEENKRTTKSEQTQ
ncbi:hypothetical protein AAZX31_01G095000 [Glycine max]